MYRSEGDARQRHESTQLHDAVKESEETRILGSGNDLSHDIGNTFSGNAVNVSATYGNIKARLDTYAPHFNADASLAQGEVSKGKRLGIKRCGKVVTASVGELHLDNLFFLSCSRFLNC